MAVDEGIFTTFHRALDSATPLASLREAARRQLAASVPREEVLDQLEALRFELRDAGKEGLEDIVLEVMDFVSGWCALHVRI